MGSNNEQLTPFVPRGQVLCCQNTYQLGGQPEGLPVTGHNHRIKAENQIALTNFGTDNLLKSQ